MTSTMQNYCCKQFNRKCNNIPAINFYIRYIVIFLCILFYFEGYLWFTILVVNLLWPIFKLPFWLLGFVSTPSSPPLSSLANSVTASEDFDGDIFSTPRHYFASSLTVIIIWWSLCKIEGQLVMLGSGRVAQPGPGSGRGQRQITSRVGQWAGINEHWTNS